MNVQFVSVQQKFRGYQNSVAPDGSLSKGFSIAKIQRVPKHIEEADENALCFSIAKIQRVPKLAPVANAFNNGFSIAKIQRVPKHR